MAAAEEKGIDESEIPHLGEPFRRIGVGTTAQVTLPLAPTQTPKQH